MKLLNAFFYPGQTPSFYSAIIMVSVLICPASLFAAENPPANEARAASVLEPGAKVELLADGFKFTEGPAVDKDGNVFFTDQPNDRIMKWSVEGKLTTFLQPCGRANGMYFDRNGNLLACADETNQLWSITPAGKVTILVKDYQGKLLNGPNDLWVNPPNDAVYFTDPLYKREYWKRGAMEQDGQHVYYLSPDRQTLRRAAEGLKQPNGIVGTPDGKKLYVADIGDRKTYVYAIQTEGTLTDRQLFCPLGSDGMTLDNEGNVYLTGRGVTIFNAQGQQIDQIPINKGWTANVCFGGKGQKMLFITATDSLFGVRMRVYGVQ